MSPQSPMPCTHDRGPGITVCLRCRQEERARAMNGLRRTLGIGAGVAVAILVIGVGTARSWQARPSAHPAFPASRSEASVEQQGAPTSSPAAAAAAERAEANVPSTPAPVAQPSANTATAPAATPGTPAPSAAPAAAHVATTAATSGPSLIAKAGRTSLANGVVVERMGDSAIVSFDSPEMRTRHLYKFERVVRRTLPALYGAVADTVLSHYREGDLMDGDLLKDVAHRGVRLSLANGSAILITPETRAGEDGPLVVRYHTRIVPR